MNRMTIAEIIIFTLILVLAGTAVLYWRHKSASSSVQVVNLFLTMRLNPEEQKEIIQWLNQRFAKDDLGQIIADEGSGYLTYFLTAALLSNAFLSSINLYPS